MLKKSLIVILAVPCSIIVIMLMLSRFVSLGSGYVADDKIATERAIEQFHSRMSAGEFEAIYQDSHPAFRQTQSHDALIAAMQSTHDSYGRVTAVTFSQLNVIVGAPVQIRAVYNTTFERGSVTELFIFIKNGKTVQLASYEIHPGTIRPSQKP